MIERSHNRSSVPSVRQSYMPLPSLQHRESNDNGKQQYASLTAASDRFGARYRRIGENLRKRTVVGQPVIRRVIHQKNLVGKKPGGIETARDGGFQHVRPWQGAETPGEQMTAISRGMGVAPMGWKSQVTKEIPRLSL